MSREIKTEKCLQQEWRYETLDHEKTPTKKAPEKGEGSSLQKQCISTTTSLANTTEITLVTPSCKIDKNYIEKENTCELNNRTLPTILKQGESNLVSKKREESFVQNRIEKEDTQVWVRDLKMAIGHHKMPPTIVKEGELCTKRFREGY